MRWNSSNLPSFDGTRIIVHPMLGPDDGIDVTDPLVDAIACEIGRRCEGNAALNRLEAERVVNEFLRLLARGFQHDGALA